MQKYTCENDYIMKLLFTALYFLQILYYFMATPFTLHKKYIRIYSV